MSNTNGKGVLADSDPLRVAIEIDHKKLMIRYRALVAEIQLTRDLLGLEPLMTMAQKRKQAK